MQLSDIRFLFAFDRWATTKVLDAAVGVDEATWSATNIVDERGLGGILVHHLGRVAALAPRPDRRARRGAAARRTSRSPTSPSLRAAWEREWAGYDAWFDRMDPAWLDQAEERHQPLAGACPRGQPRDAASLRGGGPADGRRPLPGRPRHGRLHRLGQRHGRHDVSRLDGPGRRRRARHPAGDRHRRPGRPRRPPALPGAPRARQRARPDLARPVRRGRPDRDRRRRAGRLHRRPARARGARRRRRPLDRARRPELDQRRRDDPRRATSTASPVAGSSWSRTSSGRCRARRSPGSATSPGASWSSAARPTAPPTSCSPGRCGDRRDAGPRRVIRRQRRALERLDRAPRRRRLLRSRGVQGRRRPDPAVRDRADRRRRRAGRCSTSSAISGSTRCRGPGSGRGSPAPTCRPTRSSWHARWPTSWASPTPASSARTCTTSRTRSRATFDIVYTSRGVLGWLPDIRAWARVVAHFLAPGGTFFITEAHPVVQAFENEGVAARRAAPGLPVLGARRAADLRGQGLVRRP